ncbi:superoxide dismutase [Parachitinimonas caeni]|uniref:Superoxide dismutase n=1 Tax=Parachitinimonas caeni TaxID=3031301 RepID=A0ABT7DZH6_9NEIS|nr:superoxide dismutase [Parachitinimonas caeni]MDK2125229.1 superoxide dismutase [Parachitinimonas caeni]
MNRRDMLRAGAGVSAWLATGATGLPVLANTPASAVLPTGAGGQSRLEMPALPWDVASLEPVISANTVGFHYGKHQRTYLDNLLKLVKGTPLADASLESIMRSTADKPESQAVFNNAAQVWNHTFYWHSLSPKGGGKPPKELTERLERDFGSLEVLKKEFLAAAGSQFGSGWVWLAFDRKAGRIIITKTGNAGSPLTQDQLVPLAALDVWEHAYYLDYQNRRLDYATALYDKLLNWQFVSDNLQKST